MRRRILSLLLCIVMMLSLMPTVAFAAGETWTITVHLNGGTGVESGTVEDGEYWTYPQPTKEGYTFAAGIQTHHQKTTYIGVMGQSIQILISMQNGGRI